MNGLIAKDITFQYDKKGIPILEHFNLELKKGSITVITGTSGCGKSTLCGILAGIYPRYGGVLQSGKIICDGIDIGTSSVSQKAQLIGMMFQNPDLQFCMDTVENELIFCLENICIDIKEIPRRVTEALEFCEVSQLRKRMLHTLSGGEKQKVNLACIAAMRSPYIILDEPFANIDLESGKRLCEQLRQFQRERGTTLLIVDHNISNFLSIAEEIIVIGSKGSILQRGIEVGNLSEWVDNLFQMGVSVPQRSYLKMIAPQYREKEEVILSLQNVASRYNNTEILKDISVNFMKGHMIAITGESGSGKSTILAVFSRMQKYMGSIQLEGREISKMARKHYARQVGIIFQNPQDQFVASTVYEEIVASMCRKGRGEEEIKLQIQALLEELGLWKYREYSSYMLSQGQQRRLAVGALLAYECKVLLCDEPTYGQDRKSIESIMNILLRRVHEDGLTVIFSTHDMELAKTYSDYHYYIKNGQMYDSKKKEGENAF